MEGRKCWRISKVWGTNRVSRPEQEQIQMLYMLLKLLISTIYARALLHKKWWPLSFGSPTTRSLCWIITNYLNKIFMKSFCYFSVSCFTFINIIYGVKMVNTPNRIPNFLNTCVKFIIYLFIKETGWNKLWHHFMIQYKIFI